MAKILLAYIAVSGGSLTADYCARFAGSYQACPPGVEHETVIVCQGGPLPQETAMLFEGMDCKFWPHPNDPGYDMSAFQDAASRFQPDMLVACGESISFTRPGWLRRFMDAWDRFGPGMYGTFSSNLIRPHLNTTGFVVDPRFLLGYPRPTNKAERYAMEHGEKSMWRRIESLRFPVRCVTWDGFWDSKTWRNGENILWKGDQSNLLMHCSHCYRYAAATEETRKVWEKNANGGYRM